MSVELDSMTDQGLVDLIEDAQRVLVERQTRAALDRQVAEVLRTARGEGVTTAPNGADWVAPTGAHDAYLSGDTVAHDGRAWVSLVDYNVWEPGLSGWREETGDGTPAEYVQPTGSHDAYQAGDQVTFDGSVYTSLIDGNTWSPTDYPDAWKAED